MLSRALLALAASALTAAAHAQPCPTWTHPQPLAFNPNAAISQLVKFDGKIIAAGTFTNAGGFDVSGMAAFNGTTWSPFGNQPQAAGRMAVWGGKLYTTGTGTGAPYAGRGTVWTGSFFADWPTTGPTFNARFPRYLYPLGDGTFLIDGSFNFNDDNGNFIRSRNLVTYDGTAFKPLSTTQFGPRVNPLNSTNGIMKAASYRGKIIMMGVAALSTGDNWNDTNIPCPSGFCTFDGTTFAPLVAPPLNTFPVDMAVFNGELYVIGTFTSAAGSTTPLRYIARYDENTQNWAKCGNGLSDQVTRLFVADDGSGERLHIFHTGSAIVTAYNDPNSTTNDTITFRGSVMFDGSRFHPHGAGINNGLSGNAEAFVSMDFGAGAALYVGGQNLFSSGFTNGTTLARRGPGPMADTDGDGLFDTWELNGIDVNCDGILDLDLPALGANWRHKDIFVEIDSMLGRNPSPAALQAVVDAFAAAPQNLVNNPNGLPGITLHLIVDPGDQNIPLAPFPQNFLNFHDLKTERFCNPADRAGPNRQAIRDAKRLAFRYCIFADQFDAGGSSGVAELPGDDFMVTLGTFRTPGGTVDQQAGTFMHELGHTLGLYHGGHQQDEGKHNFKPNYHSVMNYSWQFPQGRPGWTLDYSREALHDLDEHALDEFFGISGTAGAFAIIGPLPAQSVEELGAVDWNRSGEVDESPVSADINRVDTDYPTSLDVLEGSEDWSRLLYNFRTTENWSNGQSPINTLDIDVMTQALADRLTAIASPGGCPADLGIAGGLPGQDDTLDNNDFIAFITHFFNNDPRADLGIAGGLPGHDGLYDNNDFIAFITFFFEGC